MIELCRRCDQLATDTCTPQLLMTNLYTNLRLVCSCIIGILTQAPGNLPLPVVYVARSLLHVTCTLIKPLKWEFVLQT